ncbi:MAG: DegT/DnrJ/EryC1/StrS family aminotransferase [Candidatus Omnitrophota bacterium]|nr:MAG: DegT/DnrJ/EryC1/StrS family aminotransferase [Candidatus Omnitrophota bacterium]
MPVHLYGQCADMDPILEIAKRHNLKVVEDACQAHGATYRNRRAGSMAHMGCFSFYPTKNLGGYGDGGMIITRDRMLAEKARSLRNYGEISRYRNSLRGINSRLDEIQAAILRVKLEYLDIWNRRRFEIADMYNKNIISNLITKPAKMEYGTHVYHLYVIRCAYRDELREYLKDSGIETLVHYPTPAYSEKAGRGLSPHGLATTEEYSKRVLSLPLYPAIRDEEIYRVCEAINKFKKGSLKNEDN